MQAPSRLTHLPNGQLQIRAHCKLNLGLRVFPARPDGFHDLETWMVPTSWYDTLTVALTGELVECGFPHGWVDRAELNLILKVTDLAEGVPTELDKNLVGRAALALAAAAGIQPHGCITLHKVLPPGGGIGGGSSDAAAALVALNHAWNLHWPVERLEQIAATLGSDIPFFIRSRPTLCTGRGEIMSPLPLSQPLYAVLIIPPQGCPTKDVYEAFDKGHQHTPALPKTDWQQFACATADELSAVLVNDLEPAAFAVAPWLADLRGRARASINRIVHMTGSGSTLFTVCDSASAAHAVAKHWSDSLALPCIPVEILR